jgi:RNA polymerase sigma factor for flagellar operon FliA
MTTDTLINNYIPFAKALAYEYHTKTGFEYYELKSCAYLGLVQAALKYKPEFNDSFAGFAAPRIKGSIIDFLRKNKTQTLIKKKIMGVL